MSNIDLKLTDAARVELAALVSGDGNGDLIVAPAWLAVGSYKNIDGSTNLEPKWGIGLYRRSNSEFASDEITDINGIPFVFLQGSVSERLNGAILDYKNGEWVVLDSKSDQ